MVMALGMFAYRFVRKVSWILILSGGLVGSLYAAGEALPDSVGYLAGQKSNAVSLAQALKQAYEKKEITEKDLKECKMRYDRAKASIDGWISKVQFEQTTGKPGKFDKKKRLVVDDVGKHVQEFERCANEAVYGEWRAAKIPHDTVISAITAITVAATNVWEVYNKQSSVKREAFIKELEKLRWLPFDEVPVVKS